MAQHFGEQAELAVCNKINERARKYKGNKENLLKQVSLSISTSFFEEASFVSRKEAGNLYHLSEFEAMHMLVHGHAKELKTSVP